MTPADRAALAAILAKHLEHDAELRIDRVALAAELERFVEGVENEHAVEAVAAQMRGVLHVTPEGKLAFERGAQCVSCGATHYFEKIDPCCSMCTCTWGERPSP